MKIEVTLRDIKAARKYQETMKSGVDHCPVAIAARRVFKKKIWVWAIDELGVHLTNDYEFAIYKLPVEATTFIEDFDAGIKVEPFTFELTSA